MGASPEQQRLVPTGTAKTSTRPHLNADPSPSRTLIAVSLYVLTGCTQPILMTVLRQAGLADSSCQLYMLFYYFGPASAIFLLPRGTTTWPHRWTMLKAVGIALWDIVAQTLNYTGAAWAGPTIFAIVYSSVTIWAALCSQILLRRTMNAQQWTAVSLVFVGLALTAAGSSELGPQVLWGLMLVTLGSAMHGLFYVLSEAVMTTGEQRLTVEQNCAVQGSTASASFALWQIVYTCPHWQAKVGEPMRAAGTTGTWGLTLLAIFASVSFVHSLAFYHTLRHLPGGSTSAGVFKGLQAVLVFALTHLLYCGRVGGEEMCFSTVKFLSLVTVAGGVLGYGYATSRVGNVAKRKDDDILYDPDDQEEVAAVIELEPAQLGNRM